MDNNQSNNNTVGKKPYKRSNKPDGRLEAVYAKLNKANAEIDVLKAEISSLKAANIVVPSDLSLIWRKRLESLKKWFKSSILRSK